MSSFSEYTATVRARQLEEGERLRIEDGKGGSFKGTHTDWLVVFRDGSQMIYSNRQFQVLFGDAEPEPLKREPEGVQSVRGNVLDEVEA